MNIESTPRHKLARACFALCGLHGRNFRLDVAVGGNLGLVNLFLHAIGRGLMTGMMILTLGFITTIINITRNYVDHLRVRLIVVAVQAIHDWRYRFKQDVGRARAWLHMSPCLGRRRDDLLASACLSEAELCEVKKTGLSV